jgi:hypothetical protein
MKRRALLTGINQYDIGGGANNLRFCIQDVLDMQAFVQARGVDEVGLFQNITCAEELEHVKDFVGRTQPGDELFGWHSGHGGVGEDGNTPGDVTQEFLCDRDFSWDDPDTWLTDAKFRAAIEGIPDGALFYGFDACHSGGYSDRMIRRTPQLVHRYLQNPNLTRRRVAARAFGRDIQLSDQGHISLSGCRIDETSGESPNDHGGNGAMTLAYLTAMNKFVTPDDCIDLVTWMCASLGDTQHPVLAGRQDLLWKAPPFTSPEQRVIPIVAIGALLSSIAEIVQYTPAALTAAVAFLRALGIIPPPPAQTDAGKFVAWLAQYQPK